MTTQVPQLNLVLAWLWMLLGFISGLVLGLRFHREDWLGGYASFKRRLYRLAHISFFGLAIVNLLFYLVARDFSSGGVSVAIASWSFLIGAVSMPLCCVAMAQNAKFRPLFFIPVSSLILGATLTLWEVIKP
jgi:hypothetical protein